MSALPLPDAPRRDASVIALVGFAHAVSHFFHLVLPSLFPWLMADFDLSFTAAGLLMTVFFVVSGVGQALAGFAVDRFGARRVLGGGVALLALSAALLAVAPAFPGLLLAALVAGAGNAVFHPADFSLLNRRVSEPRLGHAFSVHGLSGSLGWATAPVLMTAVAAAAGWRAAALTACAMALAALAVLAWRRDLLDEHGSAQPRPAGPDATPAPTFAFLALPAVWLSFAFFLVITTAFGALQNYAPPVFQAMYGFSLAAAGSLLSAYMLGAAAGTFGGGFLGSRELAADKVIGAALLGAALGAAVLAGGSLPPWAVLPVVVAMGFSSGLAGPSRDLLVRRATLASLGSGALGRVYGFVYSGLDAGLAVAPLAFGPFMDAGRPQAVLTGVALLQAAAVLIAVAVARIAARATPAPR